MRLAAGRARRIELRDGKVWRQRPFFGPAYEAPAWRAGWVERY